MNSTLRTVLVLLAAIPLRLWAAAPANDSFATATGIGGPAGAALATITEATLEPDDPALGGGYSSSVWYRWTAPYSAPVSFTTSAAGTEVVLAALAGDSLPTLNPLAVAFSAGASERSIVFNAMAGTTYYIDVGGVGGSTGTVDLTWSYAAPPNDNFASALDVTDLTIAPTVINVGATTEPNEPSDVGGIPVARTVWYTWTAPEDGILLLSTEGSDFDTTLFYTPRADLASGFDGGNDEDPGVTDGHSNLELAVGQGKTFRIAVGGKPVSGGGAQAGRVQLTLDFRPSDTVSLKAQSLTVLETVGQVHLPVTRSGPNGIEVEYDVFIVSPDGSSVEQKHGLAEDVSEDTITFDIPDDGVYTGPRDYRVFLAFDEPGVKPGAVTSLTVHVLDDEPFVPAARRYAGYFTDATERLARTGSVALDLNRTGAFTVRSQTSRQRLTAKGLISATGMGSAVLKRPGGQPLSLQFQVPSADEHLSGTAGDHTFSIAFTAARLMSPAEFSATPLPIGRYTGFVADKNSATGGNGELFGALSKSGRWTFQGRTIDGQPYLASSTQAVQHEVHFYAEPYPAGKGVLAALLVRGSVGGAFFSPGIAAREANAKGTGAFDVPLDVRLAPYTAPATGQFPGTGFNEASGMAVLDVSANGVLQFQQNLQLAPKGTATLGNPQKVSGFALHANYRTGRWSAELLRTGAFKRVHCSGAIYTGPDLPLNLNALLGLGVDGGQVLALQIKPH